MHMSQCKFRAGAAMLIVAFPLAGLAGAFPSDAYRIHFGPAPGGLFGFSTSRAGDIDEDGTDDYIIGLPAAGLLSGAAQVFSGSTGELICTFHGPPSFSLFFGVGVGAAGDVDNDGCDDVIVGAPFYLQNEVPLGAAYVFSGRTKELLHEFLGTQPACGLGWAVGGAGDVNFDGHDDLVVGEFGYDGPTGINVGRISFYSGATGAVLTRFVGTTFEGRLGWSVAAVGDVNVNGTPDVLAGAPGAGRAFVFDPAINAMVGILGNGVAGSQFGWAVANAGDVNNDGINDFVVGAPDLLVGGAKNGRAYLISGTSGNVMHAFTGNSNARLGYAVDCAGDVDGDGRNDVVVGSPKDSVHGRVDVFSGASGARLRVYRGQSARDFGSAVAGVGDINNDGAADCLVGQSEYLIDGVKYGAAFIHTEPNVFDVELLGNFYVTASRPSTVLAAEVTNDNIVDLITLSPAARTIKIGKNTGAGAIQVVQTLTTGRGPSSIVAADIDRDGKMDLVVAEAGDDKITYYHNRGALLRRDESIGVGNRPSSIIAADFNQDSRIDLAVTLREGNRVKVLLNTPTNRPGFKWRFPTKTPYAVGVAPAQVLAARINGDTFLDLVVLNNGSSQFSILLNRGDGTFLPQRRVDLEGRPIHMAIADFDNDGRSDIAYLCQGVNAIAIRHGLGNGDFAEPHFIPAQPVPKSILAVDLNVDGYPDLAVSNCGTETVSMHLNDGSGSFAEPFIMATGLDPVSLATCDVDRDGDTDVVTANRSSNSISILRNLYID